MDGFLIAIWAVRLVFLGLLYLVLYRIVRTLLRDLRAAGNILGLPNIDMILGGWREPFLG